MSDGDYSSETSARNVHDMNWVRFMFSMHSLAISHVSVVQIFCSVDSSSKGKCLCVYKTPQDVICHVSHVTCHVSHVTCPKHKEEKKKKKEKKKKDKLVKLVGRGSVFNGA